MQLRSRAPLFFLACVTGLLATACGGGGSGSSGDFALVQISVPHNGTWQINRPMTFEFTDDVDFSTVNLNTINITQAGGAPASGEFFVVDAHTVGFQPRCPTTDDFSDSGLLPGGVAYTIRIPGSTSGGLTVRSVSGARLSESQTVNFTTPNSTDASVIFLDTQVGPPIPVIRTSAADPNLAATYLELGDNPASREYFFPRPLPDAALGAKVTDGFTAGLNLYSDASSHISILLAINQPVTPSVSNISIDTVRLEYLTAAGTWENVAHTVQLVANCTAAGALLRITPTGIMPQNRTVRVLLTRDFRDLVGDANLVDLSVGSFLVKTATDPGTATPGIAGDEAFEEFTVGGEESGSKEDTTTVLASPRADWGSNDTLRAGFAFGGTGGPSGTFDWKIGNDLPLSNNNHPQILLDTSFAVITNQQQTAQQTVINGIVDVRDFLVTASGQLLVSGPNRCTILVSGNAQIDGEIAISGNDNLSVASLNTTAQPEPGAAGRGGGGRGGAGSPLSSQSDAAGETGRGAFDASGGGGIGGESGFHASWPSSIDTSRRPAGGGGGAFGPDFLRPANIVPGYLNPNQCPDQSIVGLDTEQGFNGSPLATGVLTGLIPPRGGAKGTRPFFDGDATNDFWGTLRTQGGQLIRGELLDPWAGAGGGGGGDAINSNSFPTTPFNPFGDEKGAGGGGGGGSITILALGQIKFGPRGRILSNGGTGGGGENSGGGNITHIGGGSGGGSGGHIILQSATRIDLTALITTTGVNLPAGGLYAVGGQGGAGANNAGGAHPNGVPVAPNFDALPPNSYPAASAPCGVSASTPPPLGSGYTFTNQVGNGLDPNVVNPCTGGDGGPGIIQLHTPSLADILIPTTFGENIYKTVRPPPVGAMPSTGVPNFLVINGPPTAWDQMLPIFGRNSQAISKWVALGAAAVNADDSIDAPDPIHFEFEGTDAAGTGSILTTGAGQNATVAELPPIFSGVLAASPVPPFIASDLRTLVVDGGALADDIYLRNPALLRRFVLRLTGVVDDFEIASATYDAGTDELRVTVSGSGMPLAGFVPGTAVQIRPRFFKVLTEGIDNNLPDSSDILIEFQATTPTAQDDPNESPGAVSAWVKDISLLDPNSGGNPDYRFFRFRITFDISAQGDPLTFSTPIPSMDFIRIRFRF